MIIEELEAIGNRYIKTMEQLAVNELTWISKNREAVEKLRDGKYLIYKQHAEQAKVQMERRQREVVELRDKYIAATKERTSVKKVDKR